MELSERMMVERYELGNAQEDAALRNRGGLSLGLLTLVLTATPGVLVVALGEALCTAGTIWSCLERSSATAGGAHDRHRPEPTRLTG